ncbi:MAG: metallophosphoesterase [Candidatus Moraniibacteriota bacterium]
MKKVLRKRKRFFLYSGLVLIILAAGFCLVQKYGASGEGGLFFVSQVAPAKEGTEVTIVDDWQRNPFEIEKNKVEEEVLETDAEQLTVNEESEKNDTVETEPDKGIEKFSALPAPVEKSADENILRIGFVTDLHARSENGKGVALEDFYADKFNYFVEKMNNVFGPNFLLLDGDVIEGTRVPWTIGTKELSLVKKIADRTTIEKYWVVGNHDLRSISKKQWKSTLGINYTSKAFNAGNYRIIILDSNFTKEGGDVGPGNDYTRGNVSAQEMRWLKGELEGTDKRVLVFMHHPPLRGIEAKIDLNLPYNAKELQELFSQYGVLAVFSGHIEDLYYQEIGGVNYFVSPGMVKYPKYLGAFSEITIKDKKIDIELNYLREDGKYRTIRIGKD